MCEVNTNEVVNENFEDVEVTPVEEVTTKTTENIDVEPVETSEEVNTDTVTDVDEEDISDETTEPDQVDEVTVDAPEEERVEAEEYAVNFTLSYSQYLKGQNKTEISDQEAAGLIASVVNFYENEAPAKEVRDFFEIPESLNDKIEAKQFNIATEVVSNDTNYQIFLVKYTLTFGERIVPEAPVVDNVVDFTEVAPVDGPVEAIITEVGPESPVLTDPVECAEALGEPCQCEHCDCVKTEEGPVESCDGENCSEPAEVPSEEVPATETAE